MSETTFKGKRNVRNHAYDQNQRVEISGQMLRKEGLVILTLTRQSEVKR